jgi:hypothetical protein
MDSNPSQEKLVQEAMEKVERVKQAGVNPNVHIHIRFDELDLETINILVSKLQTMGLKPKVILNAPSTPGATPKTPPAQPVKKEEVVEEEEETFTVMVTDVKALVQTFKKADKAGKPIMIPREPRIKLAKGTKIQVSAKHKVSDKDPGDGTVFGTGNILYYHIAEFPENPDAEGHFLKQSEVKKV